MRRLKVLQKQNGIQGNQQNKNSHGSEVKYFTHRNTARFQFLLRCLPHENSKNRTNLAKRVCVLVVREFSSNGFQEKGVLSETHV